MGKKNINTKHQQKTKEHTSRASEEVESSKKIQDKQDVRRNENKEHQKEQAKKKVVTEVSHSKAPQGKEKEQSKSNINRKSSTQSNESNSKKENKKANTPNKQVKQSKQHNKKAVKEEDSDEELLDEELHEEPTQDLKSQLHQTFQDKLKVIDSNSSLLFNDTLIKQAVTCLKELLNKHYESNLDIFSRKEDEMLQVNFTLTNLPMKYSMRPVSLPVKLNPSSVRKVCLIIKDNYEEAWKKMALEFDSSKCLFELDVITFSNLKLEYVQYEQRRNLLKRFDLFLCDKGLYMLLRKVLGKPFYSSKKYPIAIDLDLEEINRNKEAKNKSGMEVEEDIVISKKSAQRVSKVIEEAVSHVCFYMSRGPNYTVKSCYFALEKAEEVLKSLKQTIRYALGHILKWGVEFDHLKTVSLKFTNSIELPIFNQLTKEEINSYYSKIEEKQKKGKKEEKADKTEKVKEKTESNAHKKAKKSK